MLLSVCNPSLCHLLLFHPVLCWVVTKISSCRVNTMSRLGIKQLGISFSSIFLLYFNESSQGHTRSSQGKSPGPSS